MAKKYYWLKLKSDFFTSRAMKKLRRIAGGDTYTIIYLKLQLLSLKDEGLLYYEGVEPTFYEEMALALGEEVDNVRATILFLESVGLLEKRSETEYLLTDVPFCIGSEGASAERVRKHRQNKLIGQQGNDLKALQCNADVTKCNTEIEKEIEIDIEGDIDKHREAPPTLTDVITYCSEAGLSNMDPEKFYDHFTAKGWGTVADWKARARIWDREDAEKNQPKQSELDRIWEKVTHDKGGV